MILGPERFDLESTVQKDCHTNIIKIRPADTCMKMLIIQKSFFQHACHAYPATCSHVSCRAICITVQSLYSTTCMFWVLISYRNGLCYKGTILQGKS